MATLDDLKEMYQRLNDRAVPIRVVDHTVSIGVYFSDPDGNGLEVYYELPRSEWHQERPFSESRQQGTLPRPLGRAAPPVGAGPRRDAGLNAARPTRDPLSGRSRRGATR